MLAYINHLALQKALTPTDKPFIIRPTISIGMFWDADTRMEPTILCLLALQQKSIGNEPTILMHRLE